MITNKKYILFDLVSYLQISTTDSVTSLDYTELSR